MIQAFDKYDLYEPPVFILCNPSGEQLFSLGTIYDRKYMPRYNSLGSISFTASAYINGIETEYYDFLEYRRLVYLNNLGYFMINEITENGDGITKTKIIIAQSLEVELVTKKLTNFKGTYKFYDIFDITDTLMGNILTYLPGWSVGSIDAALLMLYRTFDISDTTIYNFLMSEVETAYQCIFDFDTINKTISAHTITGATTNTDIYLSYDNLIKNIEIKERTDELITALSVYGGGDLSINQVNPLGTNTMYDFSYYKSTDWMSQGLIDAIGHWEEQMIIAQSDYEYTVDIVDNFGNPSTIVMHTNYADLLTELKGYNVLLVTYNSELIDLQAEVETLEGVQSVRIEQGRSLDEINIAISLKQQNIAAKRLQIAAVQQEIDRVTALLTEINTSVSFATNFTPAQTIELSPFIIGNTYQNENFIQTDIMTLAEIQDMAQELYDQAIVVLAKISQPRYEFTIDASNFILLKEFEDFTEQLDLGSIVTIELKENVFTYPVLLGIDLNYDNPEEFTLIFGNRLRLDDSSYLFSDLFEQSMKSAISTSFNSEKWSNWNNDYKDTVSEFITSALDTTLNNIISGSGQDIIINKNGMRVRKSTGVDTFEPTQMWLNNGVLAFTKDSWNTASLALGQISTSSGSFFGLVADVIVGRLLAGNSLTITNQNNTFTLDGAGATLTDATFTLQKTDGNSKIILDPVDGIKVQKRDSSGSFVNQMYIDVDGNLIFNGNLSGASGTFSGTIIANDGKIGGWTINHDGLYDNHGNYIKSTGHVRLGALSIDGSTGNFYGNFYAYNLVGLIEANQIGSLNADVINAGTIRGINIYGANIFWPGVWMGSTSTGVSEIHVDKYFSIAVGYAGFYMKTDQILLFNQNEIIIGSGTNSGKIDLKGYVYSSGEKGVTGTYPVGTSTMRFKNGIMTSTSLGSITGIEGSTWLLPSPSNGLVSGMTYNFLAAETFIFGQVGKVNSIGSISLASNTTISTASCFVLCPSNTILSGEQKEWLLYGIASSFSWSWTTGGLIYLGTNGSMTQTVPTGTDVSVQILGIAIASNKIFFNPNLVQVELV
jgi:hypothetical protein